MSDENIQKEFDARYNGLLMYHFNIATNATKRILDEHNVNRYIQTLKPMHTGEIYATGTLMIECQGYYFTRILKLCDDLRDYGVHFGHFNIELIDSIQYIKLNIEIPTDYKTSKANTLFDIEQEVITDINLHNAE